MISYLPAKINEVMLMSTSKSAQQTLSVYIFSSNSESLPFSSDSICSVISFSTGHCTVHIGEMKDQNPAHRNSI